MNNTYSGTVEGVNDCVRLDRYVAENLKLLSRSQIKSRGMEATLNGKSVKFSRLVKSGDVITLLWQPAAPLYLAPENIPLDILYEDDRCVVVNKAQGMVVHPGAGNHSGTFANALLWRNLNRPNGTQNSHVEGECQNDKLNYRNGIVHRLDKDTSGVIIAAYDNDSLAFLSGQFKEKTVRKRYLALAEGTPHSREGSLRTRLIRDPQDRQRFTAVQDNTGAKPQGKIAVTRFRVLKSWPDYSLLLLEPKTGRTHQLRVHLKYLGTPIVGDPIYNQKQGGTLMLHAMSLAIVIPGEAGQRVFKAPLPERFKKCILELNRRK